LRFESLFDFSKRLSRSGFSRTGLSIMHIILLISKTKKAEPAARGFGFYAPINPAIRIDTSSKYALS
jgi:hypothetical protein